MRYYFIRFFHIGIISIFLVGCGYKAPPTWVSKKQDSNISDVKIFDINSTLKVKIGVK